MSFVLIGAAGLAVSNVVLKRIVEQVDDLYAMGWQLFIGSIPLGVTSLATENIEEIQFVIEFYFSLLVLSLIGTALPFVIWFKLLERVQLYKANAYSFVIPIIGLILGYLFFSESLSPAQLLGVSVIILGVAVVNSSNFRKVHIEN
ncbi:MAG: DMT family transporter [Proteobacteria bacterium]|nr:DMT family transporter [Pseudomonadota bacterium]